MDIKLFKKTYKFVCDECGEFMHTEREYCEICGAKAMRKATNEDYKRYEMEKMRDAKERRIKFEKAEETRMVAEKTEKEVEKAAEKAKRKAEKTKKAAEKAKEAVERTKEKAKMKAEKTKEKAEEI